VTVPIQISWDLYQGKSAVWCECIAAGVRRAVLLPRLDVIFSPLDESPTRELPYGELDWRLVSPTDADWTRYTGMVQKQADRAGIKLRMQRIENVARWMGGRQVSVPQYHLWLYRDPDVGEALHRLYDDGDGQVRRELWGWLLAWTAPAPRDDRTSSNAAGVT
jgi:hypothetical protein